MPAPVGPVLAVSSVARPDRFIELVSSACEGPVTPLAFPDHHLYRDEDVDRILDAANGATVVTTEKDAVKLKAFSHRLSAAALRLAVKVEGGWTALASQLDAMPVPSLDGGLE